MDITTIGPDEIRSLISLDVPATGNRPLFKSVGVAMQDWAITHLLGQRYHPAAAA
jgi:hypothetical protein